MRRQVVTQHPTVDGPKLSSCARRAQQASAPTSWSRPTRPLLSCLLVLLALLVSVVPTLDVASRASAQSENGILVYDYNGDGRVTCGDFREEFPSTYTDEATVALSLYPDELSDLNRDNDATACDPSGDDAGGDAAPPVDDTAEEPLDIEPVPSDLPPEPVAGPEPVADPEPAAPTDTPSECDVIVENGRAFVYTDCADGTVQAGFQPFEGFDDFAARAQNGFGAFDDRAGESVPVTTIETKQSLPATETVTEQATESATVPATGSTGQERATGGPRVIEGAQEARSSRATARAKKKARAKAKLKRAQERKAKQARLERLRQSRRLAD